jgi:hypothetical protein
MFRAGPRLTLEDTVRALRPTVLLAALALPAAACSLDTTPGGPAANATHTLLTDDPFPYYRVARVDLFIVSVSASLSPDTSAGSGTFVTLATPNRRINILALQNGLTDELGAVTLPSGAITAVRMVIDTDSSSITLQNGQVLTGGSNPGIHWQSSAGRPTLNALIHEQILVPDSGAVVVIDYDVGQAFVPPQVIDPTSTDSGFIFSPVLHAADAARTGSLAGIVRAHSGTGTPVADASLRLYFGNPANNENTWYTFGTARSDASGAFRFAYATRSGFWAGFPAHAGETYIVAADPPVGSGLGRVLVPNLTVTAGAETALGTLVLP